MGIIDNAVTRALEIAADDSHGYDQSNRWGPDYDCSSLVISVFRKAGVPLSCTYTGNMYADMTVHGFCDVTSQVDLNTGEGLKYGDVLLNHVHHTALYIGNSRIAQASINERGGVTGGATGDQTGREIYTRGYYNYPWDCVLRYTGANAHEMDTTGKIKPVYYYTIKLPLLKSGMYDNAVTTVQQLLATRGYYTGDCDGIFGELTKRAVMGFQADTGLETDGEVGGQTWDKLIKE